MKDLPLTPIQKFAERTLLPITGNSALPQEIQKLAEANSVSDASVVELPRTKSLLPPTNDASAVLESFLEEVGKQKNVVAAHGGLDASRVFDLLSDDEE